MERLGLPFDIPYAYRLLLLLAVITGIVGVDFWWHGRKGAKWREYLFLLALGAAGAGFGVANDEITFTISPEYFLAGKGIEESDHVRVAVAEMGFEAGFGMGVLGAGVLMLTNGTSKRRPGLKALGYRKLIGLAWWPMAWAAALGMIGGAVFYFWRPGILVEEIEGAVPAESVGDFVTVWGIHMGVYLGAAVGIVLGVVTVRKRRRDGEEERELE